jgi:hypothetical protein
MSMMASAQNLLLALQQPVIRPGAAGLIGLQLNWQVASNLKQNVGGTIAKHRVLKIQGGCL